METKELKKYLKNDARQAFSGWPKEARDFAQRNDHEKIWMCLSSGGDWVPLENMQMCPNVVYKLQGTSSVDSLTAQGEWVELDITDGTFTMSRLGVHGTWSWFNWANCLVAIMVEGRAYTLTFGGWLWPNYDSTSKVWGQHPRGVCEAGEATVVCRDWVRPLTPTKIRFWKEYK